MGAGAFTTAQGQVNWIQELGCAAQGPMGGRRKVSRTAGYHEAHKLEDGDPKDTDPPQITTAEDIHGQRVRVPREDH